MEILWAPWRLEYILGPKADSCVLCLTGNTTNDEERLILHKGSHAFVIMNKFPYNNGHIMVAPYRHVADLSHLNKEERYEIMDLLEASTNILKEHCRPEGTNIGLNMGRAAGAGISEHLHFHIVPRWTGDSSFMAVCSDVRIVPEHIKNTYSSLKLLFEKL